MCVLRETAFAAFSNKVNIEKPFLGHLIVSSKLSKVSAQMVSFALKQNSIKTTVFSKTSI